MNSQDDSILIYNLISDIFLLSTSSSLLSKNVKMKMKFVSVHIQYRDHLVLIFHNEYVQKNNSFTHFSIDFGLDFCFAWKTSISQDINPVLYYNFGKSHLFTIIIFKLHHFLKRLKDLDAQFLLFLF